MTGYRLVAEPWVDLDVAATFDWYEKEQAGLGQEFLGELRATYDRVADGPLKYQHLRSGIGRVEILQNGSDGGPNDGMQPTR